MVFYGGFETHGILWRFWNPWDFTEILKDFSWGLKKTLENTFPRDGLAGETTTLGK